MNSETVRVMRVIKWMNGPNDDAVLKKMFRKRFVKTPDDLAQFGEALELLAKGRGILMKLFIADCWERRSATITNGG